MAYWKCTQRNAGGVAKMTTSPGRRQSMACLYESKPIKRRSSGTSIWSFSGNALLRALWLALSRCVYASAIATSLIGPLVVESAFFAAPVPRPPQPTRATWITSLLPANARGAISPVSAVTATA
jgi:hypothetical protein